MSTHRSRSARPGPPSEPPKPAANRPTPRWLHIVWIVGLVATLLLLFAPASSPKTTSLSFTGWKAKVDANQVKSATIDPDGGVTGQLDDKAKTHYESRIPTALNDDTLAADLEKHDVTVRGKGASTSFLSVVVGLLPLIVLVGLFLWFSRRASRQLGGVMGIGSSRAKVYDEERPKTRLGDVAGYEGAKREISEVVEFLQNPDRYAAAGAVGPRGVLMVGPPGTGKTLMARAVAGEAQVPFFALTGSSFVELFVGVGAARVRDLFAAARKAAPAIVFIDEIDAIGQRRGGALVQNDEREQTLNQLLNELDGFDPTAGVVVLAATNRPETLDPALLRPGRFDRQVEIPLPNVRERAAILAVHAERKALRRRCRPRRRSRVERRGSRARISPTSSTKPPSSPCAPAATRSRRRTSRTPATASSSAVERRRTRSCPTRSTPSPCTSPAMRWWPRCHRTPTPWSGSRSCRRVCRSA